jgi:uncharacterized RDD family membrane protein YckC
MTTADGEPENIDSAVRPTLAEVLSRGVPQTSIWETSGFWRRFGAFIVDGIILTVAGQLIALALSSVLFELGPYARIPGQLVALLYFGLLDSFIGNGQTLGKRLVGVSVRNSDGQPIGIGRSILRTSIWLVPETLNGWNAPVMDHWIAGAIATVMVLGIGGAVVATMIFNRRSGQGLHDMLTHTYVLRLGGMPVATLPKASRRQWILSGAMVSLSVLMLIGVWIVAPRIIQSRLEPIANLQQALDDDSRFFTAGAVDETFVGASNRTHLLRIEVWMKGLPEERTRTVIMNDVAGLALTKVRDIDRFNLIRIELNSRYDFGMAWGNSNHSDAETVSTWRERVSARGVR